MKEVTLLSTNMNMRITKIMNIMGQYNINSSQFFIPEKGSYLIW